MFTWVTVTMGFSNLTEEDREIVENSVEALRYTLKTRGIVTDAIDTDSGERPSCTEVKEEGGKHLCACGHTEVSEDIFSIANPHKDTFAGDLCEACFVALVDKEEIINLCAVDDFDEIEEVYLDCIISDYLLVKDVPLAKALQSARS